MRHVLPEPLGYDHLDEWDGIYGRLLWEQPGFETQLVPAVNILDQLPAWAMSSGPGGHLVTNESKMLDGICHPRWSVWLNWMLTLETYDLFWTIYVQSGARLLSVPAVWLGSNPGIL